MVPQQPPVDDDDDFLEGYLPPSADEMRAMLGDAQHDIDEMAAQLAITTDDDEDEYEYDEDDDDDEDEELRLERDFGYSEHASDGDGEWTEGYDY